LVSPIPIFPAILFIVLTKEAVCISEMLLYFNETTFCYILESCPFNTRCHENLKSHNLVFF
jgi:hypothetical protein